jgi:2-polyprenyl-3-methyl-5-hydroxy-6-metoxy-1,4-benzoquinol methylase
LSRVATWDPTEYDQAWKDMAAAGKDPHGEVAFLQRLMRRRSLSPQVTLLDAGCGTGRVAIELDKRGYRVEGTDVDSDMLGEAASKAPHLTWTLANLASLHQTQLSMPGFDLIVMAGNVILFVEPDERPAIAGALRSKLNQSGLVVAGMQLAREDGRRVPVAQWDEWMVAVGFTLAERFATWDDGEWSDQSDYVVSVHQAH